MCRHPRGVINIQIRAKYWLGMSGMVFMRKKFKYNVNRINMISTRINISNGEFAAHKYTKIHTTQIESMYIQTTRWNVNTNDVVLIRGRNFAVVFLFRFFLLFRCCLAARIVRVNAKNNHHEPNLLCLRRLHHWLTITITKICAHLKWHQIQVLSCCLL